MTHGTFTIGSDAEFMLENIQKGRFTSAVPLIKGTKRKPTILTTGAGLHHDNVLLEVASKVCMSGSELFEHFADSLREATRSLPPMYNINYITSSAEYHEDELDSPEAKELGCSPDYNVWDMIENEPPVPPTEGFRSAGAHMHIGFIPHSGNDALVKSIDTRIEVIKALDCMCSIPATVLDRSKGATERKKLYGRAGNFRPKKYGVEYRSLSNFWVNSRLCCRLMYCLVNDALRSIRIDRFDKLITECGDAKEIQRVINEGDRKTAREIVDSVLVKDFMSTTTLVLWNESVRYI